MTPITAVVITLNEEKNIGRCLDSLTDVAAEVLVIDSGSHDKTCQIAEGKGARVIARPWKGYGDQKNFGNSKATHTYILSLDADEALSDELRSSIVATREAGLDGVYGFARLANYCGQWIRHGGWYPNRKIRLFPAAIANWTDDPVHEALSFHGDPRVTWLKGDLHHYSYYTVQEHRDRAETYARLGAEKMQRAGQSGLWWRSRFGPRLRFFKMFFWKLGFLDGAAGYRIAQITAHEVRLKYRLTGGR